IEEMPVDRDRAEPAQARPLEDGLVRVDRVLAGRRKDNEPADQERDQRRQDRGDHTPGALPQSQAGRDGRDLALGCRLGYLGRLAGHIGRLAREAAHAAASLRPAPVISMPSWSSVTSGPCWATISPSYSTKLRAASDLHSSIPRRTLSPP